jgi:hypothetical protein
MTLKDLLRQLLVVAEQQPDCDIRINGEPVIDWSMILQRRLAVLDKKDLGVIEQSVDQTGRPVLNIYVNGKQASKRPPSRLLYGRSGRSR